MCLCLELFFLFQTLHWLENFYLLWSARNPISNSRLWTIIIREIFFGLAIMDLFLYWFRLLSCLTLIPKLLFFLTVNIFFLHSNTRDGGGGNENLKEHFSFFSGCKNCAFFLGSENALFVTESNQLCGEIDYLLCKKKSNHIIINSSFLHLSLISHHHLSLLLPQIFGYFISFRFIRSALFSSLFWPFCVHTQHRKKKISNSQKIDFLYFSAPAFCTFLLLLPRWREVLFKYHTTRTREFSLT